MVMPEGQRRRFRQLRHSSLKTARAWAIKELGMSLWKDVCRGWARKAWKRWLGWAMRCRLEPMKEVARMVRKHQCGGPEGQQRSGRESQQPDQDDQGEGQGYRNRERFIADIHFHLGGLDLYPEGVKS